MIRYLGMLFAICLSVKVQASPEGLTGTLNRCPEFVWSPMEPRIGGDPATDKLFFLAKRNGEKSLFKKSPLWLGAYDLDSGKLSWIESTPATKQSILIYWPSLTQVSVINFLSEGWWCRSGQVSVTHYRLKSDFQLSSVIRDPVANLAVFAQFESSRVRLFQSENGQVFEPGKSGTLVSSKTMKTSINSSKNERAELYPILSPSGVVHYLKETRTPKGKGLELWAVNDELKMYRHFPQTILGHKVIGLGHTGLLIAGLERPERNGPGTLRVADLQKANIFQSQIPVPDHIRAGEFWIKSLPEKKLVILKPASEQIARKWQRIFILNYDKKVHETLYPWQRGKYPGEIWYSEKRDQLYITIYDVSTRSFSGMKVFNLKDRSWGDITVSGEKKPALK